MKTVDYARSTSYGGRPSPPLRRLLGPITTALVGIGVAIGSGVFAAPGETASFIASPWVILALWVAGGVITLLQSLVTAELATRLPKAGAEYQYLRAAFGDMAGFVFGWGSTIFVVAGGSATIAAFLGQSAAQLFGLENPYAPPAFGCAAIAAVTLSNALGLRAGAAVQNVLTTLKLMTILAVAVGAFIAAPSLTPRPPVAAASDPTLTLSAVMAALLSIFWSYSGATDSAKLAEEVHDPRRDMPRALFGAAGLLTLVYFIFSYALFCAMPPRQMAGRSDVAAAVLSTLHVPAVDRLILVAVILICLGAVSSSLLSNVRITFALARDGLAFRFLAGMSERQSPIASLIAVGLLACVFVASRRFSALLSIYFTASAVFFGLTYISLIVFRLRERRAGRAFPEDAFRAPAGIAVALLCVALQAGIIVNNFYRDVTTHSRDSFYTIAVLFALALLYELWRRFSPR